MHRLIPGYRKFRDEVYPAEKHRFKSFEKQQKPHTLFITCSDSRVVPSMFTQTEMGEMFHCRVVGNLVPPAGSPPGGVTSAIEYAVTVLGVEHIIVCGHSDCGAMKAFLNPEKLEPLKSVRAWVEHASTAVAVAKQQHGHLSEPEFIRALTQENVISQLNHLRTHSCVATGLRAHTLQVHGWYFDIGDGTVSQYEESQGRFVELCELEATYGQPAPAGSQTETQPILTSQK